MTRCYDARMTRQQDDMKENDLMTNHAMATLYDDETRRPDEEKKSCDKKRTQNDIIRSDLARLIMTLFQSKAPLYARGQRKASVISLCLTPRGKRR